MIVGQVSPESDEQVLLEIRLIPSPLRRGVGEVKTLARNNGEGD